MSVLGCYMDESVDKDAKKVFCVGAAIGNDAKWKWLEHEWKGVLREEGISYFKASDCAAMSGEFRKFRKDDSKATLIEKRKGEAIRQKLLERMSDSRVSCFGVSVDMDDFCSVANTPEKLDAFGGTPFYHCYFLTMHKCAEQIMKHRPGDVLASGYDEHQNYGPQLRSVYEDFKATNPHVAPHMLTHCFDGLAWGGARNSEQLPQAGSRARSTVFKSRKIWAGSSPAQIADS